MGFLTSETDMYCKILSMYNVWVSIKSSLVFNKRFAVCFLSWLIRVIFVECEILQEKPWSEFSEIV